MRKGREEEDEREEWMEEGKGEKGKEKKDLGSRKRDL